MTTTHQPARRAFLQRLGQLGLAGTATPWALNLAAMGEAAAFTATDYKALVCVFLYGGNDNGNTLIPYDATGHAQYASVRTNLALARADLAATALGPRTALVGGVQYALAPSLAPLKTLFDSGRLAVQLNVGTLVQPTTVAQFKAQSVPLPPKLFSHNDQQSYWQSSRAEGAVLGWGGTLGDLALSGNGGSVFTCMSVTGNAVFLSGLNALSYQIGSDGAVPIKAATAPLYGSSACQNALRTLITQARTHVLENEYTRIVNRSISSQGTLASALGSGTSVDSYFTDTGTLSKQLKMVARLIAARNTLGLKRQVFLVSLGGFDTHDGLLAKQPPLLAQVASALTGFQAAIDSLGLAPNVTAFTASDFGRTLTSNGDGSDHGWGSTHFVLGGAVSGAAYYGTPPQLVLNGPDDVGQGRLLPSTAVDQYAATLARWFGVSDSELPLVMPNITNYASRNVGFMG